MKPTRLAVAIAAVVWSLLLLPVTPTSQPDSPRTGEQATMRQLFRDLSSVFSLTLNQDEFEDPGNHDQILSSLYSLAANVEQGKAFRKDEPVKWRCRNCGYVHEGEEAPGVCPACLHPQAHFEVLGENW